MSNTFSRSKYYLGIEAAKVTEAPGPLGGSVGAAGSAFGGDFFGTSVDSDHESETHFDRPFTPEG